jgi:hypothetical protein
MKNKFTATRKLITVILLAFSFTSNATTYYFSASGNDANNGTSTSTPWKTLSKFNSVFASKSPGDNFLFNRGDVFYGNMIISRSGSSGSPITIGAYGTGAMPVISGLTTVSSWTNLGSNIWESTGSVSSLSAIKMVLINGVNTRMGRYPNTGYLTYQSFSGKTSITSSSLSGSPNWTGAEVVIRKQRWIIDRNPITAQSGGTLTYTSSSTYNGQAGYGFFIQNDSRTLDLQNEWYYNPSTKKIKIYSTTSPTNVQVATKDTLVFLKYRNYITFDNLSFKGSNKDAFVILSSANVTIQNCSIDYSGTDAIWGNQNWGIASSSFVLKNSTINHTNNNAINLASEFAGVLLSHNTIKNTGMLVGMGGSGDATYEAIQTRANNAIIEYNEIDSVGYVGIWFANNNTIIRNNFVNGFNYIKLDGAGIYTWVGTGNSPFTGQKVLNNIVMNGFGDNAGTPATGNPISHGIYMDDWSANVEVSGNSVANCPHSGIYLHKAHDLNVHHNTSFNNNQYQLLMVSSDLGSLIRNDKVKNNIFVSKISTQLVGGFQSVIDDIRSFGTIDSNYYARPISDNIIINVTVNNYASNYSYSLSQWQAYSGFDLSSKKSPKTVSSTNDLRFEYNATTANKTVTLDGNYIDVKNVSYNGTITLAPYTSAVLIRNGTATNQPPTANAGSDKTITLPTNTVSLSGSGTDPDGSISAYSWTKTSGPASGTITSAASAATTVTGMVQGVYKFQLKVTDNAGATDLDTVQVTVNAETTLLPAVNPANTVNGLDYKYYETTAGWSYMPIFSSYTPVETGTTTNYNLSLANRTTRFAFYFTGFINVPADGQYTFYTNSDDGSYLAIDGIVVVNNDGLHGAIEKSGIIGLKAGKHAIAVGYFQQDAGSILTVSYSGPGVSKQVVPASSLYRISIGSPPVALSNNTNQTIASSTQVGVKTYPNPFANYVDVNITGGVAGEYKLMLVDVSGKVLWTKSGIKNAGAFQQSINTSALQRGIYFLKVIQNNANSVIKLVK